MHNSTKSIHSKAKKGGQAFASILVMTFVGFILGIFIIALGSIL